MTSTLKGYTYLGGTTYRIGLDTFRHAKDPAGTLITVRPIEMNDELTQHALENDAPKTIHYHKNRFALDSFKFNNLPNDISSWLQIAIKAHSCQQFEQARNTAGCYVATAVYGSYDCPQVWTLRRFYNNTLAARDLADGGFVHTTL